MSKARAKPPHRSVPRSCLREVGKLGGSDSWSCTVSVEREASFTPNPSFKRDALKRAP